MKALYAPGGGSFNSSHSILLKSGIQRLPCGHQTRPCLDTDELNTAFLVRAHKASIILIADVGPQIIQGDFHKRQSNWKHRQGNASLG